MTMRWFSKTHRDSQNQMMEAATAEVLRTRDEISRLRSSTEAMMQQAAVFRNETQRYQKEAELHRKEVKLLQVIGLAVTAEILRTRDEITRLCSSAEALKQQVAHHQKEARSHQREAKLRQVIGIAMARYFVKGDRSAVTSIRYEDVQIDSNPDWVPEMMIRPTVSEPEFMAFKYFNHDSGTILDVGANFGYAAASIWTAGATSKILSFEPNPWHESCLRRIKEMRTGLFDHLSIGLSSRASEIRFVIPVIEGIGISALSSAVIESEADWTIPENVLHHMMHDHPELDEPHLQFTEVTWRTERLDDVLANRRFDVDVSDITAMKIDVEGFEAEVLRGAIHTLRTHTPLIMIEGANRNPAVVECLSSIGYRYADFMGDNLLLSDRESSKVNGFFLHEARLDHYRDIGLLCS
jgi:FkbM family methyltransferase